MRNLRSFAASGLLITLGACSELAGFDELEKTDKVSPQKVPGPKPDGGPIDTPADPIDAGTDGGSTGDGGIPPASTTCPATPADYVPAWKSPPARAKPCKSADLDEFVANERQLFETQRQAMVARNAACASCMYTRETDATWGPITFTNDQRIFIDFGLCYRAAGAPDACGERAHQLEWCLQKICNVCLAGQNIGDCRAAGKAGHCKTALDATVAACNGSATIVNETCMTSREVVGVLCGGS